jgi:hypothetical protein
MYYIASSFRYKYYSPTPHQAHNPNDYGRALLSAPPQAIAPNPHTNLMNIYIQIANKMGVERKELYSVGPDWFEYGFV